MKIKGVKLHAFVRVRAFSCNPYPHSRRRVSLRRRVFRPTRVDFDSPRLGSFSVFRCLSVTTAYVDCGNVAPLPRKYKVPHRERPPSTPQDVSESSALCEGGDWADSLPGSKVLAVDGSGSDGDSAREAAFGRLEAGKRPDTIVLRGLPANWLGVGGTGKAAEGTDAPVRENKDPRILTTSVLVWSGQVRSTESSQTLSLSFEPFEARFSLTYVRISFLSPLIPLVLS